MSNTDLSLLTEQRDCWERGERRPVEAFLEQAPPLRLDREAVLSLIYGEIILRKERGETPRPQEYQRRFPDLAEEIRKCFEVAEALSEASAPQTGDTPPLGGIEPKAGREPAPGLPAIPGYEVLAELGRGGMGVVYKARQEKLNRLVALKMILSDGLAGPEQLARFRREAEAVAQIQHPHIVQIHEVGEAHGRPYFCLELAEGGSLDKQLHGTPWPAQDAAQLVETLAHAVHAAHERGIIHRDLKPANILLQMQNAECRMQNEKPGPDSAFCILHSAFPKITDFGLAKQAGQGQGHTQSGAIVGTPSYMAPEQASGKSKDIGPAADVYALGAILYELLTGRPPFKAETPFDTVLQVVGQEPVPPKRLQPKVPRDLETICLKCLRKQPGQRYGSALDLALDLRRFREGKPVTARPVPWGERCLKWAKRKPPAAGLVAVSATAVVTLLTVIAVYTLQLREALQAESRRRRQARAALDAMFSPVIEQWLAKQRNLLPEHRQFLEKALASYEEFARDTGQDEQARAGVAAAFRRVADIRQKLGQHQGAEDAYCRSRELYQQLATDFPQRPNYRFELATSYHNLGLLLAGADRAKEAEAAYRAALVIYRQLAGDFPNRPAYRVEVANSHDNLANLLKYTSRPEAAESAYRAALAVQKRLAADFPGEPEYRFDLARIHNNLGLLLAETGRPKEAETSYTAALTLYKQLADGFRKRPDYRIELARTHNDLASLLKDTDRPKQAEMSYRAALALQRQLAADFPNRPDYHSDLAGSYNNLANALLATRRLKKAEAAMRAALAILRQLAADFPDRPDHRADLGATYNNLGVLLAGTSRPKEAEAAYRLALALQKPLAAKFPNRPDYRLGLAQSQDGLANALKDTGRPQEAEVSYRAARARYAQLAADFPTMADYQLRLANTLVNMADLANRQRRYQEACRLLAQGLPHCRAALRANPRDPVCRKVLRDNRLALAEARLGLGEHTAARALADEMLRIGSDPVNDPYNAACILARCASVAQKGPTVSINRRSRLVQEYGQRAVALLRQALAKGYQDITHLKNDKDLGALRCRTDFRKLLAEVGDHQSPKK
jgi:tetratricopeptide (TPR) repeat protein